MASKFEDVLFVGNVVFLKQNLDSGSEDHLLHNLDLALPFVHWSNCEVTEGEFIGLVQVCQFKIQLALQLLGLFGLFDLKTDQLITVQKRRFRPYLIEWRLTFIKHNLLSVVSDFD